MSEPRSKSPFGALAALKDALPRGPESEVPSETRPEAPRAPDPFAGKIVIAKSRKGRGGKTVTTITGIAGELEGLARELKHALGCGAAVEDGAIVVQGEQVDRVHALLAARGAKKLVRGT